MKSWHDYHIHGYSVDSINKEIRFILAWPLESEQSEIFEVVFRGVQGYELSNDSMASIVSSFEQVPLTELLTDYGSFVKEAYCQNGAYGPWASSLETAEQELAELGVRAFILTSSMGLVGRLLATSVVEEGSRQKV